MLVWVSLPCTGGSSWQDLNWRKGSESTKEGIRKQWRQLKNMWNALCQIVFPRLDGRYMCMAFEWPAACSYWNWSPDVRDLDGHETPHIREILAGKLRFTSLVHGCEHELVASRGKHKGELVRKLWRIDSDCEILVRALHRDRRMNLHERRCEWRKYPCLHAKGVFHAACAGQVTRDTQLYPPKLAHAVHQAWRSHALKVSVSPCMCVPSFRKHKCHITGKKDASVAISVPKLERPVRLQYRACWAPEWLVLLPCSACNRVLQCSVYVEMGPPTYREYEQLRRVISSQPMFTAAQEQMDEVPFCPPLPFFPSYFYKFPEIVFPEGNEVYRRWQNRREGPEGAVRYCENRWAQAEYTIKECGNIYKELDIPETSSTAVVARVLLRYIPQFHPDKIRDEEMKEVANLHSRRVSGIKEWFKDDQQRYFYDKRLLSTSDDKVYEPVFGVRFIQPRIPERPEGVGAGRWVRPRRSFDTVNLNPPPRRTPPPPPTAPPPGSSGQNSSNPEAKAKPKAMPTKSQPAPPPPDHSTSRTRRPSAPRTFTSSESEWTYASNFDRGDVSLGPSRGTSLAGGPRSSSWSDEAWSSWQRGNWSRSQRDEWHGSASEHDRWTSRGGGSSSWQGRTSEDYGPWDSHQRTTTSTSTQTADDPRSRSRGTVTKAPPPVRESSWSREATSKAHPSRETSGPKEVEKAAPWRESSGSGASISKSVPVKEPPAKKAAWNPSPPLKSPPMKAPRTGPSPPWRSSSDGPRESARPKSPSKSPPPSGERGRTRPASPTRGMAEETRTTECPGRSSTEPGSLPDDARVASPVRTGGTDCTGSSGACAEGSGSEHSGGTRSSSACPENVRDTRHNPPWERSAEEQRESFWLRQMYSDLVDKLRSKSRFEPDFEEKIDEMIRRIHRLKTQEDYVETGGDIRSRWRSWAQHMLLAVSRLCDSESDIEALSSTEWNDHVYVLNLLSELLSHGSVRGPARLSAEQLKVLCGNPSQNACAPPPRGMPITVHLFGDATTLLRSNNRINYRFEEVLNNSTVYNSNRRAQFRDHCEDAGILSSIAQKIADVAEGLGDQVYPEDHVGIVVWAGSDFSWKDDAVVDQLSLDDTFLMDKVAMLAEAVAKLPRALVVVCEGAEFFGRNESWRRIMSRRTRAFLDALGVATCDGKSLCSALSRHRLMVRGGKRSEWISGFTEESRESLVVEIGKLCQLVELMPSNAELKKGVIDREGHKFETTVKVDIPFRGDRDTEQPDESDSGDSLSACTDDDDGHGSRDPFLAGADTFVVNELGVVTDRVVSSEWTTVGNRREIKRERQKTLVAPTEKEWLRIVSKIFEKDGLVPTPDGSVRVPRVLLDWVDLRCYCLPCSPKDAFAWQGKAEDWKIEGSELRKLEFPGVTYRELRDRLSKFAKPNARFMRDLDFQKVLRCVFSVDIEGWELGRDAKSACAALKVQGLLATKKGFQRYQEIGAWILDVAWTELLVRGKVRSATIEYEPLPNAIYAAMKGDFDEGPISGRDGNSFLGDLWESFGTFLVIRKSAPDWAGIRSILLRAMIAQKEWDMKPDSPPHWTDEAKGWRPGRDEANVTEPKEEDDYSEDSSVEEPEVAHDSVGSSGVCVERVPGMFSGGTGSSGACAETEPEEKVHLGKRTCGASVSAAAAPASKRFMDASEVKGALKREEDDIRILVEQTVASERAAAERLAEEERKAADIASEEAESAADEERKTKNRFTQRSSPQQNAYCSTSRARGRGK